MTLPGDHIRERDWNDGNDNDREGERHSYACDDCYYRWQVTEAVKADEEVTDEDGNTRLEAVPVHYEDPVCPMCGSHSVTER